MLIAMRGALCAALVTLSLLPQHAKADPLEINVPIGQAGTRTAPGTAIVEERMRAIPGGVSFVPAKKFQNGYALSMKDMMAGTPGILAQPRWGEESRLSIRGSGLSRSFHLRGVTLLQDGIPFNFADGSGDFQEIDPLMLQHVEVYRGGQALRYGAASLGGAVNMASPTAWTAGYNTLLRAEAGSFGTIRTHAAAAKIFDGFDAFAGVTKTVSDGYRKQSDQDNQGFSGNVGVPLSDRAETRFYVSWNDIKQEVPGTITKEAALHDPKSVPDVNLYNNYARDIRSLRVANRTVFDLDNGVQIEAGGYINDKSLYHPIFQVVDQASLDIGGFARMHGSAEIGGRKNDVTVGVNIGRGRNDAKRFVNMAGHRGNATANGEQVAQNVEFYGEDRLHIIQNWSLITGLQASVADRDYKDFLNRANDDGKTFYSLNPKIGVMWNITPRSEMYASVTRSSEAPTFSELVQGAYAGFVPVDLQTAWTVEAGTRGKEGDFSWDVTLYHAQVRDELLNFAVTSDVPASTFNADKTIHQGIELGAGWRLNDRLSLWGIYNLNDFQFDGDNQYGDNELAGAPKHQINLSMRYEKKGASIEPNIEWVPAAPWVDYANTMKADSYIIAGVKAGYDINENMSLFLDARNLTDEKTITSFSTVTDANAAATNVFYPGEGRSVYCGVTIKF